MRSSEAGRTIRRAGPADADAVRALTLRAYAPWVPVIGRPPKPMAADHAAAIRDHRVDVVVADGRIVALIEMIQRAHDLLIENLAVDPADQGRGLGERLVRHAEAVAASSGRGWVRLYTNARFVSNVAFYARRGFAVEREEAIVDGTVVHMSKPVAQRIPPR